MLGEPLPHLVIRPGPLEWMGIEVVILRPRGYHMLNQLLPTAPGVPLQVAMAERSDHQSRLVQPRGVARREAGPPPAPATRPVGRRVPRRVARVAILNQEHA